MFESLTVYETLYYAAMLRLPSTMTSQAKKDRVETVLKALGLNKCRGTIIGGFFQRCLLALLCPLVLARLSVWRVCGIHSDDHRMRAC